MSLAKPGIDTHHIIKMAMKSKSLGTLGKEEDAFQNGVYVNNAPKTPKPVNPFQQSVYTKRTINDIKEFCKDKTPDEILEAMGIDVHYKSDGSKTLSHYGWPNMSYSFAAAGIDENALLKGVKEILGNCDLTGSNLKNLGEVNMIHGELNIPLFTKIEDLSSVKYVGTVRCDAENSEDISKLFEKIHFKPNMLFRPLDYYYFYYFRNDALRKAVQQLGVRVGF